MTTTWIPDGTGVQPGGDVGGDTQVTDSYSVRFFRAEDGTEGRVDPTDGEILFSVLTLTFYAETRMDGCYEDDGIAKDSDGEPVIWMTTQIEKMICANRDEHEGTCDYAYDQSDHFFTTADKAQEFCRRFAENYTTERANRDIAWDGLATWER